MALISYKFKVVIGLLLLSISTFHVISKIESSFPKTCGKTIPKKKSYFESQ